MRRTIKLNQKQREKLAAELCTINTFVWSNKQSQGFYDCVKSICSLCVECGLDTDAVLSLNTLCNMSESKDKQEAKPRKTRSTTNNSV